MSYFSRFLNDSIMIGKAGFGVVLVTQTFSASSQLTQNIEQIAHAKLESKYQTHLCN